MPPVTLRAPIDGVVHKLLATGAPINPGVSPAVEEFERRRAGIAENRPAVEYLGLEELPSAAATMVFKVHSDVLQLQLLEERRKLRLAELKLDHLTKQRDLELGVDGTEGLSLKDLRRLRLRVDSDWEYFGNFTGGPRVVQAWGQPRADALLSVLRSVPELEFQIAEARQKFMTEDWDFRIASATTELASARSSLEIAELQTRVGEVYCSRKARVAAVHVLPFQYVTQGDPILDVSVNS